MHGEINGMKNVDSVATFITRAIRNPTSPVTIIFVRIIMLERFLSVFILARKESSSASVASS